MIRFYLTPFLFFEGVGWCNATSKTVVQFRWFFLYLHLSNASLLPLKKHFWSFFRTIWLSLVSLNFFCIKQSTKSPTFFQEIVSFIILLGFFYLHIYIFFICMWILFCFKGYKLVYFYCIWCFNFDLSIPFLFLELYKGSFGCLDIR